MITFRDSMDPHSLDVRRDDILVAMIQWHREREPRIVVWQPLLSSFTLSEMKQMVTKLDECVKRGS